MIFFRLPYYAQAHVVAAGLKAFVTLMSWLQVILQFIYSSTSSSHDFLRNSSAQGLAVPLKPSDLIISNSVFFQFHPCRGTHSVMIFGVLLTFFPTSMLLKH